MNMNVRVRHINEIIRQVQNRSLLPVKLLNVTRMMEDFLSQNSSSDDIHFDKPQDLWRLPSSPLVHPRHLPTSQLGQWLTDWEEEMILEEVRGAAEAASWVRDPWRGMRWSLSNQKAQWCRQ